MKHAPCKDCERKGCGSYHSKCEPYLEWKKSELGAISASRSKQSAFSGYVMESVKRQKSATRNGTKCNLSKFYGGKYGN